MSAAASVERRAASLMLMVASGFAGLGYQIVWTQQCAMWLGHESAAVLAVVAAFFGGLAVGGSALGPRIERSTRPVRWYAGCELVIALWSLLLIVAMAPVSAWMLRLTGAEPAPVWQWSVAFCGTFLLLLPATAAMGATLPAMERITAQLRGDANDEPARAPSGSPRSIAALYAGNTFGATIGVLAAAFWLVPNLGLARSAVICVALSLLCGATSLAVFSPAGGESPPAPGRAPAPPPARAPDNAARARRLMARLALTGFLGIGYEVLVVRVLSQVTEDTVYTFAMLLAVYLVGTAAGAAAYQRFRRTRRQPERLADALLVVLAATCLAGTATLWLAERVAAQALHLFGPGAPAAIAAEAVPALLAFAAPTIVMGALFSDLCRAASAAGIGFGRALGANTLGAAASPALFGVVLVPAIGPKLALLLIAAGYLAALAPRTWGKPIVWLPAGASLALALWAPPLAFIDVPAAGRVVSYRDGVMAAVSVVQDADGVARLRINNRQQEGSSASVRVDGRQAWLPLLLHPAPRSALFLGLGTGVTASSAAEDPTLSVDAVELLPEVIDASAYFTRPVPDGAAPVRLHALPADARRFVRASGGSYDVVVSDNFHPARSGSGSLYTVEHFQAVRLRLAPGGLFCQWLPLHQLDLGTLRSIVQSFLAVYPRASALIASNSLETPVLALVGQRDAAGFDVAADRDRLARAALPRRLAHLGLEDELAVLGSFVAGPDSLRRFAGDAAANTDDHPVVAYGAPRITYAPDSRPRDRLLALLSALSIDRDQLPGQLLRLPASDAEPARRLVAYWAARDRFIASGRDVRPSSRVQDMLAQVREPLLAALRMSPDFRPAYDPLLAMAADLARTDAPAARALLTELARVQPARAEAERVLRSLDGPIAPAARTVGSNDR